MGMRLHLSIKGAVRFVILFGFILFMWWFFRSYMLLAALVVMIMGVAASAVLLWLSKDGICIRTVIYKGHKDGLPDGIDICIDNSGRFSGVSADIVCRCGNVFTDSFETIKERVWAAPVRGGCVHYGLMNLYAGRFEVEIQKVIVYDMLHMFGLTGCAKSEASAVKYPQSDETENDDIYSVVEGFPKENESRRRGTDYNPDYEVREYIEGDELRSIHWKLSAKKGALMVRERLAAGKEKVNVVLPLTGDIGENDRLMASLYGLCRAFIKKGYPVQLFWSRYDGGVRTCFIAEEGELDDAVCEILGENGKRNTYELREYMALEYPNDGYIEIRTGEYRGAFISS